MTLITALILLPFLPACGDDNCQSFDFLAPPSAKIQVIDGSTGQPICKDIVSTDRERAVFYPDICQFWLPSWAPVMDAGASLTVKAAGFFEKQVSFPVTRNDCGEIQEPPPQQVILLPDPNYES